jgi:hypothetical protein
MENRFASGIGILASISAVKGDDISPPLEVMRAGLDTGSSGCMAIDLTNLFSPGA